MGLIAARSAEDLSHPLRHFETTRPTLSIRTRNNQRQIGKRPVPTKLFVDIFVFVILIGLFLVDLLVLPLFIFR